MGSPFSPGGEPSSERGREAGGPGQSPGHWRGSSRERCQPPPAFHMPFCEVPTVNRGHTPPTHRASVTSSPGMKIGPRNKCKLLLRFVLFCFFLSHTQWCSSGIIPDRLGEPDRLSRIELESATCKARTCQLYCGCGPR